MIEPLACVNGRCIPATGLSVPVWDAGFVQGTTVAEQMRTFNGRLFRWNEHLVRLSHSLEVVGVDPGMTQDEITRAAYDLVEHNHRLLARGDDLGLALFITPGAYVPLAPAGTHGPLVVMHTQPVAFATFASRYADGQRLWIAETRQIPDTCWPPSLKCRSRMHYYLADREAARHDPQARAILLDQDGFVSEASTANFVIYTATEGFVSPPRERILPGISVGVLEELAAQMKVPFVFRDLTVDEARNADEAYLCSTSPCLLPVASINGRPVGSGRPGEMFQRTISAWSRLVQLDIVGQAMRFTARNATTIPPSASAD